MCVLYEPKERIGQAGYFILAVMIVPLLTTIFLCRVAAQTSNLECTRCGRAFCSTDLPKLLQTGRCPRCGQAVPGEDLSDCD